MIAYNNPSPVIIDTLVGIDKAIQDVQISLQNGLGWLGGRAFGRAFRQEENKILPGASSRRLIYYPEVYQKNGEPLIMMPNDNLPAYCFFYVKDPGKPINYEFLQPNIYIYPVSVIFWLNLKKIDSTKKYRFTEELKLQVLQVFRSDVGIEVLQVFESFENVFSNYSITEEYRQYMKPPYSAFRIDFNLSFKEIINGC